MSAQLDFVTGDWVVRVTQLRLEHRHSGQVTPLEPRLAALLTSLASREGELVTKETLLSEVWQGMVVSDDSIAQAVSRLRKLLGDDPKAPRYIQTVWKKGYRWLSQVEQAQEKSNKKRSSVNLLPVVSTMAIIPFIYFSFFNTETNTKQTFEVRTLTSKPGLENNAALSSDGINVVYQYQQPDSTENTLIVQDLASNAASTLTEAGRWYSPNFSEDGNRLVFMQMSDDDCKVLVKGLISKNQTTIGDCTGAQFPDLTWHEHSNTYAFGMTSVPSKPVAIFVMDDLGIKKQVSHPPEDAWGDFNPAISPDGKWLVFTRAYTEMQHDLYLLKLEKDATEERLTAQRTAIMGASWTPDNSRIVYAARQRVGYRLSQLTLDSKEIEQLNLAVNEVIEPHIAKNGDLVATQRYFDTDIYRVSMQSKVPELLFDSTHWDLSPTIAPDGDTFVFTSNRNGFFQLWSGNLETGNSRPLTTFEGNYTVAPKFSPDSQRVIFEVHDGDFSQIHTYDLISNLQLKLTEHPSLNVMPSISSDGKRFYFASNRSGSWQVWSKPLDGGDALQLTETGGYTALESYDGTWLYFNRHNEAGIWRMDLSSKAISKITDKLGVDDGGAFAVVSDGVVYLDRSAGEYGIINHLDNTAQERTLWEITMPVPRIDPVISVSPNLDHIYIVKNNPVSGDLIRVKKAFSH